MEPDDGWEAYGIPDFSSQMLRSQNEREAIEARVAHAVRRYEPRLADVEVVFSFPDDDVRRGHFVVSGRLIAQSQAPHVRFEIALSTVA
ncbi:type VI secretion system lysozyme-like protein [Bordetella hinzii L60]|nr:type VI secretion system lysozyme-like protein [Bordetella hinzii L60]